MQKKVSWVYIFVSNFRMPFIMQYFHRMARVDNYFDPQNGRINPKWSRPCARGARQIILSDSLLKGTRRLVENGEIICSYSGASTADLTNILKWNEE